MFCIHTHIAYKEILLQASHIHADSADHRQHTVAVLLTVQPCGIQRPSAHHSLCDWPLLSEEPVRKSAWGMFLFISFRRLCCLWGY